jgi:hypothetical protein
VTAQAAPCSEVILPVGRTRSTLGCGSEKRLRKCGAAECWSRSDLPEPHLWTAFQFSVYATRKNKLRVDGKPQWLGISRSEEALRDGIGVADHRKGSEFGAIFHIGIIRVVCCSTRLTVALSRAHGLTSQEQGHHPEWSGERPCVTEDSRISQHLAVGLLYTATYSGIQNGNAG